MDTQGQLLLSVGLKHLDLTGKQFSLFVNTNLSKNVAFLRILFDTEAYLAQQVSHYNICIDQIFYPFFSVLILK